MQKQHKNVLVLSGCQATLQTGGVTLVLITGLAGVALAPNTAFATAPLTCYVIGSALTTVPASLLMKSVGRRAGFQFGTAIGVGGAALCALAIYLANFWLLCFGMLVMGSYTAFGEYYRFAAADVAEPAFRAKAISLTLAGGIVGGFVAPEMAKRTKDMFADHMFLGSYLSLMAVCVIAALMLTQLQIPQLTQEERKEGGRPIREIMRQPVFIVAALAGALSYGIMNLFMTSTPLAMRAHDHHFNSAAFVLEWHVVGMYGPSFFTGSLIQKFGVLKVILAGVVLLFGSVLCALAGTGVINFWLTLFVLGVGWNFMYVGGSALLTECHTPAERAKTQAANDLMVFITMAISSMSSGVLLNMSGWRAVNYGTVPFLLLALGFTLWLMWLRRNGNTGVAPLVQPARAS
jgi:MFS family permease